MNIFYLHKNPWTCAEMHCDKHVVKMVLETAQLLCSAYEEAPYRRTHFNHPCAKWARTSRQNYLWLCELGIALCEEYTHRYNKEHKSQRIIEWCIDNIWMLDFNHEIQTPVPQCMPDQCKSHDSVKAYRSYYHLKRGIMASDMKFTNRNNWM